MIGALSTICEPIDETGLSSRHDQPARSEYFVIPHILHQTWKTTELPPAWQRNADTWQQMHPDWEHRLWTDEMNRELVAEHYPELLPAYDGYTYPIERADAARYCMLHRFGGVYADLDIECLRPLDSLLAGEQCVLFLEPAVQAMMQNRRTMVSNALMAAAPGHPVFAHVIAWLVQHPGSSLVHRDVLANTGPLMLSCALDEYAGPEYRLLRGNVAFPFSGISHELRVMRDQSADRDEVILDAIAMGAYAVHYWDNSWVGSVTDEFFNPRPDQVPGFRFVLGLDSPGNDVAMVGRDVPVAAQRCRDMDNVVAFNTDGFAKSALLPRHLWQPLGDGSKAEGLYIREKAWRGWLRRLVPSRR